MTQPPFTSAWLDDEQLRLALADPARDVAPIRRAAIAVWRRHAGSNKDGELTPDESAAAGAWLRELRRDPIIGDEIVGGLSAGRLDIDRRGFFADLSSKIGYVSQRACRTCPTSPPNAPHFFNNFRLRPESRQSISGVEIRDLRSRLQNHLGDTFLPLQSRELCVSLTFMLSSRRPIRIDVDNLAKAMLDVMRGSVFNDDSQVQHLDLMKIRLTTADEEWVTANIRPTALNLHADVFDPALHHKFAVNAI